MLINVYTILIELSHSVPIAVNHKHRLPFVNFSTSFYHCENPRYLKATEKKKNAMYKCGVHSCKTMQCGISRNTNCQKQYYQTHINSLQFIVSNLDFFVFQYTTRNLSLWPFVLQAKTFLKTEYMPRKNRPALWPIFAR